MNNYFVYGLSGAGKDTVSNHLVETHNYLKFRIADTIKKIICEQHNLSFDELEKLKRENPEYRKAHHVVSEYLGMESSLNRCRLICDKNAFDFQHFTKEMIEKPIVICDVRTIHEMEIFLSNGYKGIFLTKRNKQEYTNVSHYTEVNIFENEDALTSLLTRFADKLTFVNNDIEMLFTNETLELFQQYDCDVYSTNGSADELTNLVNLIID